MRFHPLTKIPVPTLFLNELDIIISLTVVSVLVLVSAICFALLLLSRFYSTMSRLELIEAILGDFTLRCSIFGLLLSAVLVETFA